MIVTGYKLKEAIKKWQEEINLYGPLFEETLWKFEEDEDTNTPEMVEEKYRAAEIAVVKLQTAQHSYNLTSEVVVDSEEMTLSEAIKRVGVYDRLAAKWKDLSESTQSIGNMWNRRNTRSRSKDEEYAKRTVPVLECAKKARDYKILASKYRSAIAKANLKELPVLIYEEYFD